MSPIEAMARAYSKIIHGYESEPDTLELEAARAAIDALADNVSEGMVEAGVDQLHNESDDLYGCLWPNLTRNIVAAALKAAKDEG